MLSRILDPNTRRRLARFRRLRRAWWSLWIFLVVFILSLFAPFIANDQPLYVSYNGESYFPCVKYYPDDAFTNSGKMTRPSYRDIQASGAFRENSENRMVFPVIQFGPNETIEKIDVPEEVKVTFTPVQRVATVDITKDGRIGRSKGAAAFLGVDNERATRKIVLAERFQLPTSFLSAIEARFQNQAAGSATLVDEASGMELSLSEFDPRSSAPRSVRVTLREVFEESRKQRLVIGEDGETIGKFPSIWANFSEAQKQLVMEKVSARREAGVPEERLDLDSGQFLARFDMQSLQYPFPPVKHHPLGLDTAGRDVLSQIIHATRVSLLFGIILVTVTMLVGTVIGSIQGYFGGMVDLAGQRLTEIWEGISAAFLFIVILMGAIFGRSFGLLLFVYAIFNWIGISYYMRGEFLRLRKQPFVEAARVMGIGRWKIMFRHVLPNAVVPLITYFPFSLVAAIFALTALDFLGFGLPPDVPSWGALIGQAQGEFRHAWWLVLFPSLALFGVMLLSVFIGEGLRNAFDPRSESRLE